MKTITLIIIIRALYDPLAYRMFPYTYFIRLDHPAMKTGDLQAVLEGKGKLSVRITKKRTSVLNSQGSYLWPKMQFWSS